MSFLDDDKDILTDGREYRKAQREFFSNVTVVWIAFRLRTEHSLTGAPEMDVGFSSQCCHSCSMTKMLYNLLVDGPTGV